MEEQREVKAVVSTGTGTREPNSGALVNKDLQDVV